VLLSQAEQVSVRNVIAALKLSPQAGCFYQYIQVGLSGRAVWVAYGLRVRLLYTLAEDRRGMIVRIEDVMPTDLPCQIEYEERP
jgi:hypothetical protein